MTETKDVCWSASRKRGFWELPAGLWLRQVGYRGSGNGHRGWRIPATFPERRSALRVRVLPERHTLFLHVFRRTLFYPATALSLRSWCSGVLESSVQASGEDDVEAHALYPFVSFRETLPCPPVFRPGDGNILLWIVGVRDFVLICRLDIYSWAFAHHHHFHEI